jgi:uncharacterized membrane protein
MSGVVLGIGLGGLVDGIVMQQLLQWHHTVSSALPPGDLEALRTNVRADGMSALLSIVVAFGGLAMLWETVRRPGVVLSTRSFAAAVGAGWCAYNLMEGLILHHVLGLHHVRSVPEPFAYDLGYLAVSGALGVLFTVIARSERPRTEGARRWWRPAAVAAPASGTARRSILVTPPPRG